MPLTQVSPGLLDSNAQYYGMKNRLINGGMVIDQRNNGASVTPANGTFSVDRWAAEISQASKFSFQQNAGSVTPPAGFTNYLGVTSLSAYTVGSGEVFNLYQRIEGLNISDLAWGTASAATVTLSFWVRSSLTGTFGGAIQNNGNDRSYPFAFAINSANTWEQKSITIPGDTTGTWLTTNGIGIRLRFSLGTGSTVSGTAGAWSSSDFRSATGATSVVGTNGATFYVTGVQLERGSNATSFEFRDYGRELQMCQRYFQRIGGNDSNTLLCSGVTYNSTTHILAQKFTTTMRVAPTGSVTSGTAFGVIGNAFAQPTTSVTPYTGGTDSTRVDVITSTVPVGGGATLYPNASNTAILLSAEL